MVVVVDSIADRGGLSPVLRRPQVQVWVTEEETADEVEVLLVFPVIDFG